MLSQEQEIMTARDFVVRLLIALILGAVIGIERQWLRTKAVLKTNVLVSIGSAMFVMMSAMVPGDTSPTRVAAQVVSGIGFLGGGVILRDGGNIRGLNTAATLWCAAAIGTLAGAGFFFEAYCGALAIVGANFFLRPLVQIFQAKNEQLIPAKSEAEIRYRCCLQCRAEDENTVRTLLLQPVKHNQLILIAMYIHNLEPQDEGCNIEIKADFLANNTDHQLLEEMVSLLRNNARVNSIRWELSAEETD